MPRASMLILMASRVLGMILVICSRVRETVMRGSGVTPKLPQHLRYQNGFLEPLKIKIRMAQYLSAVVLKLLGDRKITTRANTKKNNKYNRDKGKCNYNSPNLSFLLFDAHLYAGCDLMTRSFSRQYPKIRVLGSKR